MISSLTDLPSVRSYLNRVGAEPRSLKTAVVKESRGKYWRDIAVIRFKSNGEVDCPSLEHCPTEKEQADIYSEWGTVTWPELSPITNIGSDAPEDIKNAPKENVFEFRGEDGRIRFVQVRVDLGGGDKVYIPWTYWTDGKWRKCEPEGSLPLYNAHRIKESTTIFIHEGAKAAAAVQRMVDENGTALKSHPWGIELSHSVHVGWIGGALSPSRTDWSPISKHGVKIAYIVADNDAPGIEAVPAISERLRVPTFLIQFTHEWPKHFDLADPFPKYMFGMEGNYKGPPFRACTHPATWATDLYQNKQGKPSYILRDSFKGQWSYIEEIDQFVHNSMPNIMRPAAGLNNMLMPYSHTKDTAHLILKAFSGRTVKICYRPDQEGTLVTEKGVSAINLHIPSMIRPYPGDATPWLEFMRYLFVKEREMKEALRWCATLIARPDIRMGYGLLLISEKQGVGKTTLGATILRPLVGEDNTSVPGENDITSQFNDWVAQKRLSIISEIYSGTSWKAYHSLKAIITDRDIQVNKKFMQQYTIENWCHILASSNSMRALKMENDDRRWFYPEVTEVAWPPSKFMQFRQWLDNGGLNIIRNWADGWKDYVLPGERAPMTARKRDMIEGSRSEAQSEAAALASLLAESTYPKALLIREVVGWVKSQSQGKVYDTEYEIKRAMTEGGAEEWGERIKIGGRAQSVLINKPLLDILQRSDTPEKEIRSHIVRPAELMERDM
jgi:hypothetical protein